MKKNNDFKWQSSLDEFNSKNSDNNIFVDNYKNNNWRTNKENKQTKITKNRFIIIIIAIFFLPTLIIGIKNILLTLSNTFYNDNDTNQYDNMEYWNSFSNEDVFNKGMDYFKNAYKLWNKNFTLVTPIDQPSIEINKSSQYRQWIITDGTNNITLKAEIGKSKYNNLWPEFKDNYLDIIYYDETINYINTDLTNHGFNNKYYLENEKNNNLRFTNLYDNNRNNNKCLTFNEYFNKYFDIKFSTHLITNNISDKKEIQNDFNTLNYQSLKNQVVSISTYKLNPSVWDTWDKQYTSYKKSNNENCDYIGMIYLYPKEV